MRMLCAATFALDSTSIRFIPCKELPCRLFDHNATIIELDEQDNQNMVASNQKILINNREVYFSSIDTHDVIVYKKTIFVIINTINYNHNFFFIGCIAYKNLTSLLFAAPKRIDNSFFKELLQVLSDNNLKQIIINCKDVFYMDGDAISALIELIDKADNCHCSLLFYSSSSKFISYLTLSNIGKKITRIEKDEAIETAMDASVHMDTPIPFVLKNSMTTYPVRHDIVNYVGRIENLCNVLLKTPLVSRLHSAIFRINNCVYLIDCGSTNGTYINDKKTTPFTLQALKLNDKIFFGSDMAFMLWLNTDMTLAS